MRVNETINLCGVFWSPQNERQKISGQIRIYDGGNIELETICPLGQDLYHFKNTINYPVLLGVIEKIGNVTFFDCRFMGSNLSSAGLIRTKIFVSTALFKARYLQDNELHVNTFSFSIEGLDEWINISGIEMEPGSKINPTVIKYMPPSNISITLATDIQLQIHFSSTISDIKPVNKITLTQEAQFNLISRIPLPLQSFRKIAHRLTLLLCFATNQIVSIKNVTATHQDYVTKIDTNTSWPLPMPIFYRSLPFSDKSPDIFIHSMLFEFRDLPGDLSRIIHKWISLFDDVQPALDLYFSVTTKENSLINTKFLMLSQALEILHRRTNSDTQIPPDEYAERIASILTKCPVDWKEWLENNLAFANELSLSQRLKSIMDPVARFFGTQKERKRLIRKIVATRNYFTHFNMKLECEAAEGRSLLILCLRMEALLQIHLLKLIGFDDTIINSIVSKNDSLSYKLREGTF